MSSLSSCHVVVAPDGKTQARTVLRLNDELAPFQAAVSWVCCCEGWGLPLTR